jgi:hypothetical protein
MPASLDNTPVDADEDEDDYMNMVIAEPTKPREKETYTQRRLRKEREAETRGRTKSKAELAAEQAAAREAALSRSLIPDPADPANPTAGAASQSKGLAMMAKMGFKPGAALGKGSGYGQHGPRTQPIGITMKEDRGGIGLDSEKKRKFREEMEGEAKRLKAEEGEYRERVRREREDARAEGMLGAAMRVAERMYDAREEEVAAAQASETSGGGDAAGKQRKLSTKPLKSINVLWRGLVRKREEKERDRRMRYDLQQSLSRLPTYDDPDEDRDDKRALGKETIQHTLVEDLEEEDPELDAFNGLDPAERLQRLVGHLRSEHNYCFWCKYTYPDTDMEGCPGLTEEDHD